MFAPLSRLQLQRWQALARWRAVPQPDCRGEDKCPDNNGRPLAVPKHTLAGAKSARTQCEQVIPWTGDSVARSLDSTFAPLVNNTHYSARLGTVRSALSGRPDV